MADTCCTAPLASLPFHSTGAVVTLVKDGRIFYNKGFGYSGTKGHNVASKARAERDKLKAAEDERLAKQKMQVREQ
eukprot:SAG22_NODE_302_length_12743_cov_12.397738_16_plen_76_part_00